MVTLSKGGSIAGKYNIIFSSTIYKLRLGFVQNQSTLELALRDLFAQENIKQLY